MFSRALIARRRQTVRFLRRYHWTQKATVVLCAAMFFLGCYLLSLDVDSPLVDAQRKIEGNLELSFDYFQAIPQCVLAGFV